MLGIRTDYYTVEKGRKNGAGTRNEWEKYVKFSHLFLQYVGWVDWGFCDTVFFVQYVKKHVVTSIRPSLELPVAQLALQINSLTQSFYSSNL